MDGKEKKIDQFELEAKTSGGAVFELGVKTSKHDKAVRRMAQPLMDKYWKNTGQSVTTLHRVYRVAEYLLKRSQRHKLTQFILIMSLEIECGILKHLNGE